MTTKSDPALTALAATMLPIILPKLEAELKELNQTGELSVGTFKRKQLLEELIFKAKHILKRIEEMKETTQSETDIKLSQWKEDSNEAAYLGQLVQQIQQNHGASNFKASQFTHTDSLPVPMVQYVMASMMSNTHHNVVTVHLKNGSELVVALGKPNSDEWITNLDNPLKV